MIKDAKGKNVGKTIHHHFHYFEEKFQYRIERSPVITGDLKNVVSVNYFLQRKDENVRFFVHHACKKMNSLDVKNGKFFFVQ